MVHAHAYFWKGSSWNMIAQLIAQIALSLSGLLLNFLLLHEKEPKRPLSSIVTI